ncbi:MAG: hypothetical protein K0S68_773 [Candidatus Saccharibacteria bacterium]|nr:hypothetical protein [Candidatus Saccharibacteria bacterium]
MKPPWRGPTIKTTYRQFNRKTITAVIGSLAVFFFSSGTAYADRFDDQIAVLRQQAAAQANQAAALRQQARDYRGKVAELNAQITYVQTQINLNQAQFNRVTASIEANKLKLAQQKAVLSANIKTMYLDSAQSPIEMLASTNNFSDFLDQQQYQDKIKNKIQEAMTSIQTLQKQLSQQQQQLTTLLANQRTQRAQLDSARAEMNALVALAERNAAAADAQVRNSNAEVGKLKAQQAAELMRRFGSSGLVGGGSCGGGYPGKWCNVAQDSVVDNWGMYNRECVSYAAFKVAVAGKYMPYWGGRGHAYQWDENARGMGLIVNNNPAVGAIAQTDAGPYGHVAYVEAVLPGGQVYISQYNFHGNGLYSEMTVPAGAYRYIHFR